MARRRYISTKIATDPELVQIANTYGDFPLLLYTWGIAYAEDDAVVYGTPSRLLLEMFPGRRDLKPESIESALLLLHNAGMIIYGKNRDMFQYRLDAFYKYQTYITEARRRTVDIEGVAAIDTPVASRYSAAKLEDHTDPGLSGGEQRSSPQTAKCADNSAEQRTAAKVAQSAQNSASFSLIEEPISRDTSTPKKERGTKEKGITPAKTANFAKNSEDRHSAQGESDLPPDQEPDPKAKWSPASIAMARALYDVLKERDAVPADKSWFGKQASFAERNLVKKRTVEEIRGAIQWGASNDFHSGRMISLSYVDHWIWPQFATAKGKENGGPVVDRHTAVQTNAQVLAEIERNAPKPPKPDDDDEDVPF